MDQPQLQPLDTLGRPLRDLRLSLTDRCNLRCTYCMPAEVFGPDHAFLPEGQLLDFAEIERLVRIFARLGVEKLRLTGGEPLLRPNLADLVARLMAVPGIQDLALTTNGTRLATQAAALRAAGLRRVTVSLDALDDGVFRRMNGGRCGVAPVLAGIEAAAGAGLPVKINMVVERGVNEDQIVPLAHLCRERGWVLRCIEFMDVGNHNGWSLDQVFPARDILARLASVAALEPIDPAYRGEVARRWRYLDGRGEVGIVASITAPFCRDCSRARLSADGKLYTCLFATLGTDLRAWLRHGMLDTELERRLAERWRVRDDRYSEQRGAATQPGRKVEMSYIGG